jgi:hypothetical protein
MASRPTARTDRGETLGRGQTLTDSLYGPSIRRSNNPPPRSPTFAPDWRALRVAGPWFNNHLIPEPRKGVLTPFGTKGIQISPSASESSVAGIMLRHLRLSKRA